MSDPTQWSSLIEPVFVPLDPPPARRPARDFRADAVLRAIEASYAPELDVDDWLEGICSELDGLGIGSWGSLPVSKGLPIEGARMIIASAGLFMRVNERARTTRAMTQTIHTEACLPKSRVVDVMKHWLRLFEIHGVIRAEAQRFVGHELAPATAVLGTSTNGEEGVILLLDSDRPLAASVRGQLEALGAHVEHAFRLRTSLLARKSDAAAAVLSPDGSLLHAEGAAASKAESLAVAVKESEKARGRLRRLAPMEAVETWRAMVEGQWTVMEQVERDGKRLLLAFENSPVTPALTLSPEERKVVSYAALGHSQKYIAYELGLSPSSVSRSLSSALRKLRLKSSAELISVYGSGASRTNQVGSPKP